MLKSYTIALSLIGAAVVAIVYALITDAIIRSRLLQTLGARAVPKTIRDHVIVRGLGSIGYRVALGIRARGVPVVVVERSEDARFGAAARAAGIPVIQGDGRLPMVLDEVDIRSARAIVAVTTDDLANLTTTLNARAVRPGLRCVVRVFDPDFATRVREGFAIRFTRSVTQLAAPAFAAATIGRGRRERPDRRSTDGPVRSAVHCPGLTCGRRARVGDDGGRPAPPAGNRGPRRHRPLGAPGR